MIYIANETVLSAPSDGTTSIIRNAGETLVKQNLAIFSPYLMTKTLSLQRVGLCAGANQIFNLPSSCLALVSQAQWYRDGVQIEPHPQDFIISALGELAIRNLSESTAGYYVCTIMVDGLGVYQVVQANIILAPPSEFCDLSSLPTITY